LSGTLNKCPYPDCNSDQTLENRCKQCHRFVIYCPKCASSLRIDALYCRVCREQLEYNIGALYQEPKVNYRKNGIVNLSSEKIEFTSADNHKWAITNWAGTREPLIDHGDEFKLRSMWIVGYGFIIYVLRSEDELNTKYYLAVADTNSKKTKIMKLKNFNITEDEKSALINLYFRYGTVYIITQKQIFRTDFNVNNFNSLKESLEINCYQHYSTIGTKEHFTSNIIMAKNFIAAGVKNAQSQFRLIFIDPDSDTPNKQKYYLTLNGTGKPKLVKAINAKQESEWQPIGEICSLLFDGVKSLFMFFKESRLYYAMFFDKNCEEILEFEKITAHDDFAKHISDGYYNMALYYKENRLDNEIKTILFGASPKFVFTKEFEWRDNKITSKGDELSQYDNSESDDGNVFLSILAKSHHGGYEGKIIKKSEGKKITFKKDLAGDEINKIFKEINSDQKNISEDIVSFTFNNAFGFIFSDHAKIHFLIFIGSCFTHVEMNFGMVAGEIQNLIYFNKNTYVLGGHGLYCVKFSEN